MAIQKINLSFKSSLLENVKNKSENSVSDNEKATLPQKQETEDSFTKNSEQTSNTNKKYWLIGLGGIIGITGLVIAAKKGAFGKWIKNLLHGRKTSQSSTNNLTESNIQNQHDIVQSTGSAENKAEPKIKDNGQSPKVSKPDTPSVVPEKPKKPVIITSVPITDEIKAAIDNINSVIDRNVPQISDKYKSVKYKTKDELMKIIEEDVNLKAIDKSKCEPWFIEKDTYKYSTKLQNGDEILIIFDKDMNIISFEKHFTNSKNVVCYPRKIYFNREGDGNIQYRLEDYIDVTLDKNSKFIDAYCHADKDLLLNYNSNGRIISAETTTDAIFHRKYGIDSKYSKTNIVLYDESGNISEIHYFDKKSGQKLKTQKFVNAQLYEEIYNINGKDITITKSFI